ncbi:putative transposase [Yersinia rohdei]|nr:putative transposase [Yersinia rohdei]
MVLRPIAIFVALNPIKLTYCVAFLNKSSFDRSQDQITALLILQRYHVAKQKFKIANWATYNKVLINRGSLIFWLDETAIQAWYDGPNTSSRGRPQRYSELAIYTVLMLKRVFRLTLRAAQGFIDAIFTLMTFPLRCPDYSCVSVRQHPV